MPACPAEEGEQRALSSVHPGGTTTTAQKSKTSPIHTQKGCISSTERRITHWHDLPRNVVNTLFPDVFKLRLDVLLKPPFLGLAGDS